MTAQDPTSPPSTLLHAPQALTSAEIRALKSSLKRIERIKRVRAAFLVSPLFLFLLFIFLVPLGMMLTRSFYDPLIAENMERTTQALEEWRAPDIPSEEVFAAAAQDLKVARETRIIGRLATRLNYEEGGMRSLITKTGRRIEDMTPPYRDKFIEIDEDWQDPQTWAAIKRLRSSFTLVHYLSALDMQYNLQGEIVKNPQQQSLYIMLFMRTLWISAFVTVACLLLGFPIAYLLSILPQNKANILMILVLLPFWTSLLVRTTSWIALLQTQGVINDVLVWIGLVPEAGRLQMIFNIYGTLIAMTQILLPFMILPLYSVMKNIPPSYMKAAQSLGAHRFYAFWKVYLPNTIPGIGAGSLLVFILAVGYYITPALVGGESGQMISNQIAYHMQRSLNWGLAAALSAVLLFAVTVLYVIYHRVIGIDRLKLG